MESLTTSLLSVLLINYLVCVKEKKNYLARWGYDLWAMSLVAATMWCDVLSGFFKCTQTNFVANKWEGGELATHGVTAN